MVNKMSSFNIVNDINATNITASGIINAKNLIVSGTTIVNGVETLSADGAISLNKQDTLLDTMNGQLNMTLANPPPPTEQKKCISLLSKRGFNAVITFADGRKLILTPSMNSFKLKYINSSWSWKVCQFIKAPWVFNQQQGSKLVGDNIVGTSDQGTSIALSSDGNTLAVGGITDNSGVGAVWVFTRTFGVWSQQGPKLVGSGFVGTPAQGQSVSLSADGNTLAVGGYLDDAGGIGAVWVFTRTSGVWSQQGPKLVRAFLASTSNFGRSVSLSSDGNILAIGSPGYPGGKGAVFIFNRSSGIWSEVDILQPSNNIGTAAHGFSVSLSASGTFLAAGGFSDDSNKGATWIWEKFGPWTQRAKLIGSGAVGAALQGTSVSMSANGDTVAIGGPFDDTNIGAVWIFNRRDLFWVQVDSKLVGNNAAGAAKQGISVALSADGQSLVVGGPDDNSFEGVVWVFEKRADHWFQQGGKILGTGNVGSSAEGRSVAISSDGNTLVIGGTGDDTSKGATWVYI